MLQAVGMTGKQLKKMLMEEGLIYAGTTILISLVLILAMEPLTGECWNPCSGFLNTISA